MLSSIRSWFSLIYRRISPFYRNPVQLMPSPWLTELTARVLPNPHLAHATITQLIKSNPHVEECLREMDGEYLLQAVVDELSISFGTLWVNVYRLGSTLAVVGNDPEYQIAAVNARRVCAEGWTRSGLYQFFVHVSHRGFRWSGTIKAIKDDRKYAVQYDPNDPVQSWRIPLDEQDMERLGFNKHFH